MIKECITAVLMGLLVVSIDAADREIFEDIKKAGEGNISGVIGCSIYIIKSGSEFINFVSESIWPNPETERQKEIIARELKVLRIEQELNRCLVKNKNGEKGNNSLPQVCKEVSEFYAAVAGYEALNRVGYAFNVNR